MTKERVFISWSGERAKAVARALRGWLPVVVQQLDPWMSDKDVSSGARWFDVIGRELERSKAGVMCVTPENRQSAWLHFEAGALAKHLDAAKVCPYLFGMSLADLERPLAEFQSAVADEAGTLRVVQALNVTLGDDALADMILEKAFRKHWPDLKAELDGIPSLSNDAKPQRDNRELLEEILGEVRGLKRDDNAARTAENIELFRRAVGYRKTTANDLHRDLLVLSAKHHGRAGLDWDDLPDVSERLKPSKFGRSAGLIGEGAPGVVTEEKRPGVSAPSLKATGSLVDAT